MVRLLPMRSLTEEVCSACLWICLDLGLECCCTVSLHLTAPAEHGMPVADQPTLNPGFLIPEVDHPEAQAQLEQHCQIPGQGQTLNPGL